jgi:hypothetical protein
MLLRVAQQSTLAGLQFPFDWFVDGQPVSSYGEILGAVLGIIALVCDSFGKLRCSPLPTTLTVIFFLGAMSFMPRTARLFILLPNTQDQRSQPSHDSGIPTTWFVEP